jgi:hypothetical protein
MRAFKLISSGDLAYLRRFFNIFFTPSGLAIALIFIIAGQVCLLSGWKLLLYSWDPGKVPVFSGLIYLATLLMSIIVHEVGHLAVALRKGDLSAGIHVQFYSWRPAFVTKSRKDKENVTYPPVFDLAGVIAQLLFASSIGVLFYLTGYSALPASGILIDMGALSPLVLMRGSDGHNFFSKIMRYDPKKDPEGPDNKRSQEVRPSFPEGKSLRLFAAKLMSLMTLAGLALGYLTASCLLLFGIHYQWFTGIQWDFSDVSSAVLYIPEYVIMAAPVFLYFVWGLKNIFLTLHFLKDFSYFHLLPRGFGYSSDISTR